MTWKRINDFKVWVDRDFWAEGMAAWEWTEPVKGITLVAHHPYLPERKRGALWFISEKSTGLRLTLDLHYNRKEAMAAALKVLEKYSDEHIRQAVEGNVIKQVRHQIGV